MEISGSGTGGALCFLKGDSRLEVPLGAVLTLAIRGRRGSSVGRDTDTEAALMIAPHLDAATKGRVLDILRSLTD